MKSALPPTSSFVPLSMPVRALVFLLLILVLCSPSVFSQGPKAKDYYKTAQHFLKRGSYDDAIDFLELAVKAEPSNKKYREELKAAKKLAALRIIELPEFVEANPATLLRRLEIISKAQALAPDEPVVAAAARRTDKELSDVRAAAKEARGLAAQGDFTAATVVEEKLHPYLDAVAEVKQLQSEIVVQGLLKNARELAERNDLHSALDTIGQALSVDSVHQQAIELRDAFRSKLREALQAEARKLGATKDPRSLEQAAGKLAEAERLSPVSLERHAILMDLATIYRARAAQLEASKTRASQRVLAELSARWGRQFPEEAGMLQVESPRLDPIRATLAVTASTECNPASFEQDLRSRFPMAGPIALSPGSAVDDAEIQIALSDYACTRLDTPKQNEHPVQSVRDVPPSPEALAEIKRLSSQYRLLEYQYLQSASAVGMAGLAGVFAGTFRLAAIKKQMEQITATINSLQAPVERPYYYIEFQSRREIGLSATLVVCDSAQNQLAKESLSRKVESELTGRHDVSFTDYSGATNLEPVLESWESMERKVIGLAAEAGQRHIRKALGARFASEARLSLERGDHLAFLGNLLIAMDLGIGVDALAVENLFASFLRDGPQGLDPALSREIAALLPAEFPKCSMP